MPSRSKAASPKSARSSCGASPAAAATLEARAQHPGARALTSSPAARFIVGIDLGTTNSAVACGRGARRHRPLRDSAARRRRRGARRTDAAVFPLLHRAGTREPARSRCRGTRRPTSSPACSPATKARWFPHARSRRRNPGSRTRTSIARRRSCRGAASRRRGCRRSRRRRGSSRTSATPGTTPTRRAAMPPRLEQQQIVLTVPASFDEEARELTVEAARRPASSS